MGVLRANANGILDLAAIESGAGELELGRVELTADVIALLRPVARRGNNQLRATVTAGAETSRSDATKLRQLLLTIIGNACNYTAARGLDRGRARARRRHDLHRHAAGWARGLTRGFEIT